MQSTVTGRVIVAHKASYVVMSGGREYTASVRGYFHVGDITDFPKVGDEVTGTLLDTNKLVIDDILPRRSTVTRKSAHDDTPQVLVTNVDAICIVMGLDADFSLRRLERYLTLATQSQIPALVVLNKADVVADATPFVAAVAAVVGATPVYIISAKAGTGMASLQDYCASGKTIVLLGSSGAGKSTITNYLLRADTQATNPVRDIDSKGRHTTTHRSLFSLPTGGFVIDTPGMRELGFVTQEEVTGGTFADIEECATQCRFANCDHIKSAGCAVQAAIAAGVLDADHFKNYLKLQAGQAESRNARKRD